MSRSKPGQLQGHAVQVVDVPGAVGDEYRVEGTDRVQLMAEDGAVFGSLGVVVLEALHPLARRGGLGAVPQGGLDGGDAGQVAVGGHHVADAAVQHVDVSVDEAGEHGAAREVEHLDARADKGLDVPVAADAGDAAIAHGHGLGARPVAVHGDDVGVLDDRISLD